MDAILVIGLFLLAIVFGIFGGFLTIYMMIKFKMKGVPKLEMSEKIKLIKEQYKEVENARKERDEERKSKSSKSGGGKQDPQDDSEKGRDQGEPEPRDRVQISTPEEVRHSQHSDKLVEPTSLPTFEDLE